MNRLLIFIPAYEASSHIEWVINRIPDISGEFDVHVLVIDDASGDGTAAVADRAFKRADRSDFTWSVLANPRNLGYGGNQKLGYKYAIEHGFDVVVMVHGDGQYPPEEAARLAKEALTHGAAFGSRMAEGRNAMKGGMPGYKFVGNRILTRFQNRVLGTELTEFHSGFRAYSTETLRRIPFELNSPDFHFDTEIFIQCTRAGVTIGEINIPTHYGDEICRVDGMEYAGNVVSQTMRAKLQDMGLMYERKFDVSGREYIYETKMAFRSPATAAYDRVVPGSTVLDLGSSTGHLAKELRNKGCRVIGVDLEAAVDEEAFDRFIEYNLDQGLPEVDEPIDTIMMLDVIEHLRSPEAFVSELATFCRDHNVRQLLISTGNVAFIVQRAMLAMGQFNYGPRGILDMTHTRLFTQRTIERLFRQGGFQIAESFGLPVPFPLAIGDNTTSRALVRLNDLALKVGERLFSYQLFLNLRPPVNLSDLISQSEAHADVLTRPRN